MRRLSLVVEVKKEHLQFYKYEPMDQMFYIDHGNKLPNPLKIRLIEKKLFKTNRTSYF